MIKFIVGLGNPGQKYQFTRHNLGRRLIEKIARKNRFDWKQEHSFQLSPTDPSYVLLNTYMNLSGEAVSKLISEHSVSPETILVCYDDFDLALGTIRVRKKGSGGSHNGLNSIIEHLNTPLFPRLRLGIGPLPPGQDAASFVLAPFSSEEEAKIEEMLEKAESAIHSILEEGLEKAMNRFNG